LVVRVVVVTKHDTIITHAQDKPVAVALVVAKHNTSTKQTQHKPVAVAGCCCC
jgi:hypothetical protein